MLIRNSLSFVIFLVFTQGMLTVNGQQKVDLDRALTDNPDLYSGSFSRIGIGFSRSNFNYGAAVDGIVLNPIHLSIDLGKRMSRKFGAYFTISGEVLIREKSFGVDMMNQWLEAGMRLGSIFYLMGGNSYFAPEVGLDLLSFDYEAYLIRNPETPLCAGLGSSLKYGYDIHLSGKLFLGGQLFISYAYCWETGTSASIPAPAANSFIYGAALSLKIGK